MKIKPLIWLHDGGNLAKLLRTYFFFALHFIHSNLRKIQIHCCETIICKFPLNNKLENEITCANCKNDRKIEKHSKNEFNDDERNEKKNGNFWRQIVLQPVL